MERLAVILVRAIVWGLQALPLRVVARIGRAGGAIAYWVDARHRRVAWRNLNAALADELDRASLRRIVREHFRRLGENYCCAIKTAAMSHEELRPHLTILGREKLRLEERPDSSFVFAIGHFGNFELYARANVVMPGYQFATTYRALRQPGLNRILLDLRGRSGCLLFERRTESAALRAALARPRLVLGFLSDQSAGRGGVPVPFFGRSCSTSPAPALFAQRYGLPLYTAVCYRTGLARWRIEVGDEIPTTNEQGRRTVEEILADINRAFEVAVRRDPANWFWVHDRWKRVRYRGRYAASAATAQPSRPTAEDQDGFPDA